MEMQIYNLTNTISELNHMLGRVGVVTEQQVQTNEALANRIDQLGSAVDKLTEQMQVLTNVVQNMLEQTAQADKAQAFKSGGNRVTESGAAAQVRSAAEMGGIGEFNR